ncbi:MAG: hypothetical protein AAFU03_18475 [Bacteroidota bacterium]
MKSIISFLFLFSMLYTGDPDSTNKKPIFPTITGDLLSGGKATLPDYAKGQASIIVLVYEVRGEYARGQNQSLAWQAIWEKHYASQDIGFYEVPMIRGTYKIMRSMTNKWMRDGIPEDFHPNVITVYGKKKALAEELGIENPRDCFVCLIDEEGYIVETLAGAPAENSQAKLAAAIEQIRCE